MANNADSIVVGFIAMILLENDFWRHVARRSGGFVRVFPLELLCNSEVGYLDVAVLVENEVLRLDISVYYAV